MQGLELIFSLICLISFYGGTFWNKVSEGRFMYTKDIYFKNVHFLEGGLAIHLAKAFG